MMQSNALVLLLVFSPTLVSVNSSNESTSANSSNESSSATSSTGSSSASCSNESSFTGKSNHSWYTGCQSKTRSGRACQKWSDMAPHSHTCNVNTSHNYCRNPGSCAENTIWCYTDDPLRRWEVCDPDIPDFLVTKCEKDKCKTQFDAVDKAGLRQQCANSRDTSTWGSLDKCCPTMQALGKCVTESCTETDLESSMGTDTDLSFHLRLAGALCGCFTDCFQVANLTFSLLQPGVDMAAVQSDVITNRMKSPVLQAICSKTGIGCVTNSTNCKALGALTSNYTLGNRWDRAYQATDFGQMFGVANMASAFCEEPKTDTGDSKTETDTGGSTDGGKKDDTSKSAVVSMEMEIAGLDYDKVIADKTVKDALETEIKTSVLDSLPEGYTQEHIKVTFSKGSVKAKVDITPLENADSAELSKMVKGKKDDIIAKAMTKVAAVAEKNPSVVISGETLAVTAEDPVLVDDKPTGNQTSTGKEGSASVAKPGSSIGLEFIAMVASLLWGLDVAA